ncbi:aminotransferase class III-fold pyridoxal phosphate-dependent enzyme [Fulvivirga sp. M361]|uniref:aminotransferase class III-fold pyridoxal phosphate-dependent enzyme n=1 Tax=Fulvivirga sp. M361 TaxID=2594266 RepID=UPI00117BD134|nr:aminotransferase class III-fold pyridoxal phosphate-dependent enzyme [Fulvivirga sp. M361]TRX59358.1 aminotransferase class III-fold pyridoxal phosphate-dependent enzyme [Fulvivirga sp. M361]
MKEILKTEFGFRSPKIKRINGYDNVNYCIREKSDQFIFKTYTYNDELLTILNAENEALLHLQEKDNDTFPRPIPFRNGDFIKTLDLDGKKTICRMLSFLEGEFSGDQKPIAELYRSFGSFLAEMDVKFQTFDNYIIRARQWEWDIQYLHLNKKYLEDIPDPHDRNIVSYFFLQFEEIVIPVLPGLRKQIIHNDANEWNVLVNDGKVSGIIDFGDLAYTPLINELAVAIVYACYDKEDPLKWIPVILKSYHDTLPLEQKELNILYYLIAARLCISVCNSAHAKKTDPDNTYATVSEKYAWKMLHKWLEVNPRSAENLFRETVGIPVRPQRSASEEIQKRHQHLSPILSLSYSQPIFMDRAAFQYMYDTHGNTFLDAYNNIPHVGHSHPRIVEAGQRQLARLNTNTRYLYNLLSEYAEKLLSKFPKPLKKIYFVNSGSAATDLAMRMVYARTQHRKTMVLEHGYHGNTQMAIDISDYKFSNPKGQGQKDYIIKIPIPDTYRGKYTDEYAGQYYATEAVEQIEHANSPIAAFIAEPIVGCGGQIPLADGYLKGIYPAIRKQGGICISDEVQTGFGRLGGCYWGFEAQEVIPDLVIIGKPMGNGHPIGAVVTTDEIAESFSKGVEFFSSFGGNPVSCAIGLAVLEVIEEERLQENAKYVGAYYKSLFMELQKKYDCIGDVRGSGLFLGVDIVEEGTRKTDRKLAGHIKNELRQKHILISTDGPDDNVLKTKPPLCFTRENAEEVIEAIGDVLKTRKE